MTDTSEGLYDGPQGTYIVGVRVRDIEFAGKGFRATVTIQYMTNTGSVSRFEVIDLSTVNAQHMPTKDGMEGLFTAIATMVPPFMRDINGVPTQIKEKGGVLRRVNYRVLTYLSSLGHLPNITVNP